MSHSHTAPLRINPQGWLDPARHLPSPNFNCRPAGCKPRLIVIHNISLPPAQYGGGYVEQFFLNTLDHSQHPYFATISGVQVSAHLFINRTGAITQFVSFNDRAWHAGQSSYLGVANCNDYSIGIELEGSDNIDYTNDQYHSLANAVQCIQQTYPDTLHHLTGHSDIAPGRKTDPSTSFNWHQLRSQILPSSD